ncbi:TPA: hypothetical protein ACPZO3_003933 [Yersinia enterocolitica]
MNRGLIEDTDFVFPAYFDSCSFATSSTSINYFTSTSRNDVNNRNSTPVTFSARLLQALRRLLYKDTLTYRVYPNSIKTPCLSRQNAVLTTIIIKGNQTMMYFLKKQKQKKSVKKVNKILNELESIYLDLTYFDKDNINLFSLIEYTNDKLDQLATVILSNEQYLTEQHQDLIERANRVQHIALKCGEQAVKEFEKELLECGGVLA